MKTIIKTVLYLQMIALYCATAFAAPNLNEKDLYGPILSVETAEFVGTTRFVDGHGTGKAKHLGQFAYTFVFEVDLLTGIGLGTAEFTAANGDTLITTTTGLGVPLATPGFFHVVEEHTIVEGTGRFANASGSFTLNRIVNPDLVSIGTVDGTIVIHKE